MDEFIVDSVGNSKERTSTNWEEEEKTNRKKFEGDAGTLNERVVNGIKAGHGWQEDFKQSDNRRLQDGRKVVGGDIPLQDFNSKPIMVWAEADVVSLYPNIDGIAMSKLAGNAVRNSKVSFNGINYLFLCV